jgi:PAS domain S-box-containing protein
MGIHDGSQYTSPFSDYETMYRIVAENTYDLEFWLNPEGRYVYVSPSALRITGYSPEEFIRDPQLRIRMIHPDDLPIFTSHWGEVERQAQMGEIEFRIHRKDGRIRWISHACQPIFNESGQYLGVRGCNRDITDRKEAQEALARSSHFANKVLKASLNGLYIFDCQKYAIIYINPEYTRLTGYSLEKIRGFSGDRFLALIHEDDRAGITAHIDALQQARDDEVLEIEYRFQTADRTWMWCFSRNSVFSRDKDGRIQELMGTFVDVTRRKKAEESLLSARDELQNRVMERTAELRKRETLLQEKNELLEFVFANVHFLLAYLDTDFNFIRVNRAYSQADGRNPNFFIGKNHFELFPSNENEAIFRKVLESGEPVTVFSKPFVYPDQPERGVTYWDWSLFPVKGPAKAVKGLILCLVDVTQRRKAEEELIQANRNLEKLKNELIRENRYLQDEIRIELHVGQIVGESIPIRKLLNLISQVCDTDATVLILGETGTGKELVARAIHSAGNRSHKPLIKIDCASIPPTLIESELFGHERGAYTGADGPREGRLNLADGGTVFLDEIGELAVETQAKLLRVLQEGEFETVGSSRTRKVDIRFIAATNRDLWTEVQQGRFRKDLYYRLSVFPIKIPPLRQRKEDIPLLAFFFLERAAHRMGRTVRPLSEMFVRNLVSYRWPGNVRELQNVIERTVITGREDLYDLFQSEGEASPEWKDDEICPEGTNKNILNVMELRQFEMENLKRALYSANWRVSGKGGAAELLGIPPSTLTSRMKAFKISRPAS